MANEDEDEPQTRTEEPRWMTGAGFVVILLCSVLIGTLSDSVFHWIWPVSARRTGWVGPLAAVSVFAYLVSAGRTQRIRQLFADKL
jgi:hypothetical protein